MERIVLIILFLMVSLVPESKSQCIKGNCYNGKGTYQFANGDKYYGQWKEGKMNGTGKYEFANGDRYNGTFHDNKRDGTGVYVWKNKGSYTGQWKVGKREGTGVFKWENSASYNGFWNDDQIIDMDVNTVTDCQEKPTFGN
jgi:hypothetical protein